MTVISKTNEYYISPKGSKFIKWLCQCDCGNEIITTGSCLKSGSTKSCGCLNNEKRRALGKSSKKYNTYDFFDDYGVGYTSKGEKFYFDSEDYEKIKDYCWFIDNRGYVLTNSFGEKPHRMIQMHRLLTDFPEGKDVDHINHDTVDNRKKNLRICSHGDNQKNMKLALDNTTGVTGVYRDKARGYWLSCIQSDNKTIHLGRFTDFDDAVKARKEAEKIYFGEYSYDESMKKAKDLGIPIISEEDFIKMIGE